MSTYNSIAWFPLAGGLTALGFVLSYLAWRRRGVTAGLRGVAWSLVPVAAYLTGAIEMLWKIGTAIGDFATSFVFSPEKWAGVAVIGLAAVLFVVTGIARGRQPAKTRKERRAEKTSQPAAGSAAGRTQAIAPKSSSPAKKASKISDDDDFSEVEQILRNRGIS